MAFHRGIVTFIFGIIFLTQLFAQYPNIRVSQPGSNDPEEVVIAINPLNPLNLAAGANINYYYYSNDGGLSWTEGELTSSLGVWGDPCVIFDVDGNLYFSHLSNPQSGNWLDRIVVQKSTTGGVTWNNGVGVGLNPPKDQDKEWLAVDETFSPYRNNLYMSWTEFDAYGSANPNDSTRILFSRSTDGGLSWSTPLKVSDVGGDCIDSDNTVEGAVPAVGPNGEIYLSWSGPLGIMFDKSGDGGATFGTDIYVTEQPGGWDFEVPGIYRCNGLPITACDISDSPYQGNVYIAWSDQRNGTNNTDVFFIKSTDGGETWGEVKQVNDDATATHQFFTWMTVDQITGSIYYVFYDRRNSTGLATDVYVAKSDDGGETFSNFRVNQSSFTPSAFIFFGDYTNIAARNGKVYPIWMRMDGFDLSVWAALLEFPPVGIALAQQPDGIEGFELYQNYPNPFNPETAISYRLATVSDVEVQVYNLLGQRVKTLIREIQAAGIHTLRWDGQDEAGQPVAGGMYLYRLIAGEKVQTKKMLLIR